MGAADRRRHVERSHRHYAQPDRHRNYTRYTVQDAELKDYSAQFLDVSDTGMRLLSRLPTKFNHGDIIYLEFTLPGSTIKNTSQARVVRKVSDFEFAVRFMHLDSSKRNSFKQALEEFRMASRRDPVTELVLMVGRWAANHKQGLVTALVGAMILGSAGAYIYKNSDEYMGRSLRSWGDGMKKEWFANYYKKLDKYEK